MAKDLHGRTLTHKLSLHLKTSQLPDFIGKSAFFFGKSFSTSKVGRNPFPWECGQMLGSQSLKVPHGPPLPAAGGAGRGKAPNGGGES